MTLPTFCTEQVFFEPAPARNYKSKEERLLQPGNWTKMGLLHHSPWWQVSVFWTPQIPKSICFNLSLTQTSFSCWRKRIFGDPVEINSNFRNMCVWDVFAKNKQPRYIFQIVGSHQQVAIVPNPSDQIAEAFKALLRGGPWLLQGRSCWVPQLRGKRQLWLAFKVS